MPLVIPLEVVINSLSANKKLDKKNNEAIVKNNFIFVTGSNGKSTVSSMIYHLLKSAKYRSILGGNIGIPVLGLPIPRLSSIFVIEASSYQLNLVKKLKPNIAILTNLTREHIEWHGSIKNYISSKEKLFVNQNENDLAIINIDSKYGLSINPSMSLSHVGKKYSNIFSKIF